MPTSLGSGVLILITQIAVVQRWDQMGVAFTTPTTRVCETVGVNNYREE